jgi:hypothetical protein
MSWRAHKTTRQRRIITLQEWATYLGVSRPTFNAWLTQYESVYKDRTYDARDIFSILDFHTFLRDTKKVP